MMPRRSRDAFSDFYRTTILSDETDPNKLHDLQADLDNAQIYSYEQIDEFVGLYLGGAERDRLDPILDACVANYLDDLDEDGQVDFKGKAKAFVRTYAFLSCVLPYTNAAWEKRSIFLNFLIAKLPAPQEEDLSKGILDAIDMDSYRVEKQAMQKILLPTQTPRSSRCRPVAAAARANRNWTASRTSSGPSTTFLETSSGKTETVCGSSLPRQFPPASLPTPPSRMPATFGQTERPHRARQGSGAGNDADHERR